MSVVVAIEGMECSGKSTVVEVAAQMLQESAITTAVVGEFSDSPLGAYLHQRLTRDRFLRDPEHEQTAWTQIFSVAADTAFALEYTIPTLRKSHRVVLKDRYRESLVACQHTVLADEYNISDSSAREMLADIAHHLPDIADLLIWLDVPAKTRYERLHSRGDFIDGDETVFRRREAAYHWLLDTPDWGREYRVIDGTGSPDEVAARVVTTIMSNLAN